MFQQSIRNQSVKNTVNLEKSDKFVNLETIKEKFDESENANDDDENNSSDDKYQEGLPQEIDQAIVEQVYSSDWNERQSAMEKLKECLKSKNTVSEEYSIELFSVL